MDEIFKQYGSIIIAAVIAIALIGVASQLAGSTLTSSITGWISSLTKVVDTATSTLP